MDAHVDPPASTSRDRRPPGRPAVFVDRDGVLNVDRGYVHRVEDLELYDDAIPALARIERAGYLVVIVSNQSGIARGLFTSDQLNRFNAALAHRLRCGGVDLPPERFYACPHLPDGGCDCRKPRPGLILTAALDLALDLSRSLLIGDRETDVEAARNAGVTGVLLDRCRHLPPTAASLIVHDLHALAELVESR